MSVHISPDTDCHSEANGHSSHTSGTVTVEAATQTEGAVYTYMDMLANNAVIRQLEEENMRLKKQLSSTEQQLHDQVTSCETSNKSTSEMDSGGFTAEAVDNSNIKNIFQYYTGFPFCTFLILLNFLFPNKTENPIEYDKHRKDVQQMSLINQQFLVLCRLRNGFDLKDLAFRFGVSIQSASVVFKSVINYMYLRLGYISFWPHRNVVINHMPKDYFAEFPTSIAIIDCTEVKTETPSAFDSQSQCYSEYKTNTTLKSLIATDPRGSIMFVSVLFSGCISDNEICKESGFFKLLGDLKQKGFLLDGDAIMADKGFRIEKDLSSIGLGFNIPPFSSSASEMTASDVSETRRIATHRIHVERAINTIKKFKLVNRKIPVTLFHNINEIWYVCSMLTNFQPTLVQD